MSIGTILIGIAMLIVATVVVGQPLRQTPRRGSQAAPVAASRSAADDYDTTLLALRDLEFDHQLGVVDDDHYARLRAQLMAQAAAALEKKAPARDRLDEAIESAVRARRRSQKKAGVCSNCREPLDDDDKFCPQCGALAAVTCSSCQHPVSPGDKFCTDCGASLGAAAGLSDTGK